MGVHAHSDGDVWLDTAVLVGIAHGCEHDILVEFVIAGRNVWQCVGNVLLRLFIVLPHPFHIERFI
jgi:hypothetical protein